MARFCNTGVEVNGLVLMFHVKSDLQNLKKTQLAMHMNIVHCQVGYYLTVGFMSAYPAYLNAYLIGIIKTGEEKARKTESGSLDIRSNMSL